MLKMDGAEIPDIILTNLTLSERTQMLCTALCPPNPYIEALIISVMVFGGGALRRWLVLDKIMNVEPTWWD